MGTAGNVAPAEQVLFLTDENNLYLDRVGRVILAEQRYRPCATRLSLHLPLPDGSHLLGVQLLTSLKFMHISNQTGHNR